MFQSYNYNLPKKTRTRHHFSRPIKTLFNQQNEFKILYDPTYTNFTNVNEECLKDHVMK